MANSTFPVPVAKTNRAELGALGGGRIPFAHTPDLTWVAKVTHSDFASASQTSTITVAATTTLGRLAASFTRGGSQVVVAVTLDAGQDQDDLAGELETAVSGNPTLSTWIDSISTSTNVVTIDWEDSDDQVDIELTFEAAQVIDLNLGAGDQADGDYVFTFSGGGLGSDVVVTVPITAATSDADLGIAVEAAIEGEAGLSGVVLSADDDGSGNCVVQFAPGVNDAAIAVSVPAIASNYDLTFSGTPTDGDYVVTFTSDVLPAPVPVTVTRSGGAPATNNDLAAAMETAIEADPQLAPYVASADATGAVNAIVTYPGVEFTLSESAPAPGALASADTTPTAPSIAAVDDTPTDPTATVNHLMELLLNDLQPRNKFPANVVRLAGTLVRRVEGFATTTLVSTLDDGGTASTDVLSAVDVSSAPGWSGDTSSTLGDVDVPEADWEPRIVLSSADREPTAGEFEVHVRFTPMPR